MSCVQGGGNSSENRQRCELKNCFFFSMFVSKWKQIYVRLAVSDHLVWVPLNRISLLTQLTWLEVEGRRGGRGCWCVGVLRWWFELTSWPAANLDLMKYERRPAADTNCNSFIKETRFDSKLLKVVWVVERGGVAATTLPLIRVPVSRYNWIILYYIRCEGVHWPKAAATKAFRYLVSSSLYLV